MSKGRWTKRRKRLAAALVVGLAGLVWGLIMWQLNLGLGLRRASYDLPFALGVHPPPKEVVLVYIDEASHNDLDQPLAAAWDRRLHARLIERLGEEGARMIVFDILFHDENPEQDPVLAAAIKNHGNVVLGAERVRTESETGEQEILLLAAPELRRAAAGWGLTAIPTDPDGVVRYVQHKIPTDFGDKPSLAEFVRQRVQGGPQRPVDGGLELINYYGPPGKLTGYSYGGVILDRSIPEGAFRDKIVIVGAKQQSGLSGAGKDSFPTPYSQVRRFFEPEKECDTSGLEIHGTVIANLLEGSGMRRLAKNLEFFPILISAFVFAAAACLLSPNRGIPLCLVLGASVAFAGVLCHQAGQFVFLWAIPAFGQMPLIAALALGAHYRIEYSARWKLRRAFKSYMSDEQARQIDEDDVSLEPGGKEIEVTVLFSDLAGFTSMSEGLPPQALAKALIAYFESATEGILDNNGTIIKYIGDAVLATWGAPLKTDRKAGRAIDAAIQMQVAARNPVTLETESGNIEQVLETRVGINHGLVLAGNLGSSRRFDYTVVGDSVNTAARLEGLNKMLGTSILVTRAVMDRCEGDERYLVRRMGSFVLKGKTLGIEVFEILGRRDDPAGAVRKRSADYLRFYQDGLAAFQGGDFWRAADCFGQSLKLHDRLPEDPASRLFLDAIATAGGTSPDLTTWRGEVALDSK